VFDSGDPWPTEGMLDSMADLVVVVIDAASGLKAGEYVSL
jgi:hypothetical protein